MKSLILLLVSSLISLNAFSQNYFGAEGAGKYNVGATLKFDGEWSVGLDYTHKTFPAAPARPIQFNVGAELNISSLSYGLKYKTHAGLYQLYANGNDFKSGFGLGTGLTVGYDYCMIETETLAEADTDLCLNLDLYPGYYSNTLSLSPRIKFNLAQFDLNKTDTDSDGSSVEFLPKVYIGAKFDRAWASNVIAANAYYTLYTDKDEEESDCEPEMPLTISLGASLSF
jgi:hypothetical protein